MSISVDAELKTFRDKMSPFLNDVNSLITSLTTKLDDINIGSKSAVSSLSSCYQGEGLSNTVSAFNSIESAVEGIKTSLTEQTENSIKLSKDLLDRIKELDDIETEINNLESELASYGDKWTANSDNSNKDAVEIHNNKIDLKKEEIDNKTEKYIQLQNECKEQLTTIKSLNPELDLSKKNQVVEVDGKVLVDLETLTPGTYNYLSYTGSNGKRINYYLYVPADAKTTEGLPVHLYMTGSGEVGNANGGGLGKLLKNGQQSSGIVVVLEASEGKDYQNGAYFETAKELTDNIVTTYKADSNRISISGHSLGGAGCISMAEKYPDYFSVVSPVCGFNTARGRQAGSLDQAIENLSKCNIQAILGVGDTESINAIKGLYSTIGNYGNMSITMFQGGHRITNQVYGEQVEVNGKTYANWLEYCMSQTKKA